MKETNTNLTDYYKTADLIVKRYIMGLICPEKLTFRDTTLQPTRVHAAIPLICWTGAGSSEPKNKLASDFEGQSNMVSHDGLVSNQLREDLRHLYVIKTLI